MTRRSAEQLAREARALRENLLRRKAQDRARTEPPPDTEAEHRSTGEGRETPRASSGNRTPRK